ncbi:hypothetical protein EVAR_61913_1 [Eumeta japonica]|uniref:Uncharacterized protein n=1 Tax=Eumeta variegata TaxID=151549 RepID=A0A4C1YMD4_EUMVA|nr:hypothetical protein EVAR_61913_1 [Eumeta japonica]
MVERSSVGADAARRGRRGGASGARETCWPASKVFGRGGVTANSTCAPSYTAPRATITRSTLKPALDIIMVVCL